MTVKTLAFLLFNTRRSHLSAFDHEHHLVSWLRIKLCDVGATTAGFYFSSCETGSNEITTKSKHSFLYTISYIK